MYMKVHLIDRGASLAYSLYLQITNRGKNLSFGVLQKSDKKLNFIELSETDKNQYLISCSSVSSANILLKRATSERRAIFRKKIENKK